jgi:hypothetical protein
MRVYQFRHVGRNAKPSKACCNREDRIIRQLNSFGQSKFATLFDGSNKIIAASVKSNHNIAISPDKPCLAFTKPPCINVAASIRAPDRF